jgi:hypothetical protein
MLRGGDSRNYTVNRSFHDLRLFTFDLIFHYQSDIHAPVGLDFGGNWIPVISSSDSASEGWSPCRYNCFDVLNRPTFQTLIA